MSPAPAREPAGAPPVNAVAAELRDLYREVILDHSRKPRNYGALEGANRTADGFNPLCGDRLRLFLRVEDGVVEQAAFTGEGCAISTASASLLTEALPGREEAKALELVEAFPPARLRGGGSRRGRNGCGRTGWRARKVERVQRRARLSGAGEVRDAGVAHAAGGARREQRGGHHGMIGGGVVGAADRSAGRQADLASAPFRPLDRRS